MRRSNLLLADALINLFLGLLLVSFPTRAVEVFGIPQTDDRFYPTVLGAVLLGIAAALWIEHRRKPGRAAGLGLAGATSINLIGAVAIIGWLVSGRLAIPAHGRVVLWIVAIGLVVISLAEVWKVRIDRQG